MEQHFVVLNDKTRESIPVTVGRGGARGTGRGGLAGTPGRGRRAGGGTGSGSSRGGKSFTFSLTKKSGVKRARKEASEPTKEKRLKK